MAKKAITDNDTRNKCHRVERGSVPDMDDEGGRGVNNGRAKARIKVDKSDKEEHETAKNGKEGEN